MTVFKIDYVRALLTLAVDYPEEKDDLVNLASKQFRSADSGPAVLLSELVTFQNTGKIQAIREYKTRTGLGLKESKDAIEYVVEKLGLTGYVNPVWPT